MTYKLQRGILISFEGGEGSGKSTQQLLLFNQLETLNIHTIVTREPGGTVLGIKIRKLLLELSEHDITSSWTELMLYLANRAQHIIEIIRPALNKKQVVICDRFIDSSEVYQGIIQGIGQKRIRQINKWICNEIWPDLTILLDIDPKLGLKRILKRRKESSELILNRLDNLNLNFHYQIRTGFQKRAEAEPKRIKLIDGSKAIKVIAKIIWNQVKQILNSP